MRKRIPIIVAAFVITIGAMIFFVVSSNSGNTAGTGQDAGSFNGVSTEGQSIRITIQNEGRDGSTNDAAVLEVDSKSGVSRYKSNADTGKNVELFFTKDAYYECTGAGCQKLTLSQDGGASINPEEFQYSSAELEDFKGNSSRFGTDSCPAGKCDVWKSVTDSSETTLLIDPATKRISKVVQSSNGVTSTAEYEYANVSIQLPTSAQEVR